MTAKLIW